MKPIAVLLAAVLLLAGCSGSTQEKSSEPVPVGTSDPLDDDAAEQPADDQDETAEQGAVVDIAIQDGRVTPRGERVDVGADGRVTLVVTSDVAEEIHVHSDPEHTYEVPAGGSITETFTLTTPGQVAVEAHELDATIVQLVVR